MWWTFVPMFLYNRGLLQWDTAITHHTPMLLPLFYLCRRTCTHLGHLDTQTQHCVSDPLTDMWTLWLTKRPDLRWTIKQLGEMKKKRRRNNYNIDNNVWRPACQNGHCFNEFSKWPCKRFAINDWSELNLVVDKFTSGLVAGTICMLAGFLLFIVFGWYFFGTNT